MSARWRWSLLPAATQRPSLASSRTLAPNRLRSRANPRAQPAVSLTEAHPSAALGRADDGATKPHVGRDPTCACGLLHRVCLLWLRNTVELLRKRSTPRHSLSASTAATAAGCGVELYMGATLSRYLSPHALPAARQMPVRLHSARARPRHTTTRDGAHAEGTRRTLASLWPPRRARAPVHASVVRQG